jgi:nucleotide-binding universal stress UspA family protein
MFDRILVPLDGSELAELALQPALQLARASEGRIILLRCIIPVYMAMPVVAYEYEWAWPEYAREQIREDMRDYLHTIQKKIEHPDIDVETLMAEGDAASMIVDSAETIHADLIVMSTHGHSGMKRWMLGSVAERVLHSAACPVLMMRSDKPISRMLIPLDGSPLAERALEPALSAAAALQAHISLLRVVESLIPSKPDVEYEWSIHKGDREQWLQQEETRAETYLAQIARRFSYHGVESHQTVLNGGAEEKILAFARLHNIDLIAMSTHGHTGLRRWLYGSVTAKVMHDFEGHMFIVRPPHGELA